MKTYRQVTTKQRNPTESDWYNTDKGELYFHFGEEDNGTSWSCREEYISPEYPSIWYEEVSLNIGSEGVDEQCARKIMEDNFKGLADVIEDKDTLEFYRELIVTCIMRGIK